RMDLSPQEEQMATVVQPIFLAWLQNKIADYADFLIDYDFSDDKALIGEAAQQTFLRQRELKAKLMVLEELYNELQIPADIKTESNTAE
ncbi:MAG TPA: hypothetical protein V6C65_27270, partial [Allocoleopsis sp.]